MTIRKEKSLRERLSSSLGMLLVCLFGLSQTVFAADVDQLQEKCAMCHGAAESKKFAPSLAGYSEIYFSYAVSQFQKHERPCESLEYPAGPLQGSQTSMCEIAQQLSEDEIAQLAEWYSAKRPVRLQQPFDASLVELGLQIHNKRCDECHGKEGGSPQTSAGLLGGQKIEYLREQIAFMRDGKRIASKKMKNRLDRLLPEEIDALVNYYGSLR